MKNNRSKQRRGFTLVELLIVIVVIGVLSAMMMLSSTEAVTSARASNIVSNLRNLKTAATAMYVDYQDGAQALQEGKYASGSTNSMDTVVKYMNKGGSSANTTDATLANYGIKKGDDKGWYVYISGVESNVGTKLAGRAQSVGLLSKAKSKDATYTGGAECYMFVLIP